MHFRFLFLFVFISCVCVNVKSQEVSIVSFKTIKKKYTNHSDTTYIVNFFASWCKPCIEEIPVFTECINEHQTEKIKMIWVSLDSKRAYEKSLIPILRKHKILTAFILDEPNTKWINKLDKTWTGAIPATYIINTKNGYKIFLQETVSKENLNSILNSIKK